MSCADNTKCSDECKAGAERTSAIANLGIVSHAEWLIERFGPQIAEALLDFLIDKSKNQGVLPQTAIFGGLFDGKRLVAMLLEKYGPELLAKLKVELTTKGDVVTKFVSDFKATIAAKPELWAKSLTGALQAVPDDIAAKAVIGALDAVGDEALTKFVAWFKS